MSAGWAPIAIPAAGFRSDEEEARWLADTISMRATEAVSNALGVSCSFPSESLYELLLIGLQSAGKRALTAQAKEHDRRVTELLKANNREVERRRQAESIAEARGRVIDEMMGVVASLRDRLAAQAPREERAAALHDPNHVCPVHGIAWAAQRIDGVRECGWRDCSWVGSTPGTVDIPHEGKVR